MVQSKRRINSKMAMMIILAVLLIFADKQLNLLSPVKSTLAFITHPLIQLSHATAELSPAHAAEPQNLPRYVLSDASPRKETSIEPLLDAQLREENRKLRQLLKLKEEQPTTGFITAQIISQTPHMHHQSFLIDQGVSQGVRVGQGILSPQGVVGVISETSLSASRVMSLTDNRHQIFVENLRSGERAIARGARDALELLYVQPERDFKIGDLLVTTGLDTTFPAGMPVGRISRIKPPVKSEFALIQLAPSVALGQLDYVLLVERLAP